MYKSNSSIYHIVSAIFNGFLWHWGLHYVVVGFIVLYVLNSRDIIISELKDIG